MRFLIMVNNAKTTAKRSAEIPVNEEHQLHQTVRAALIDFINSTPIRVGDTIKIREVPVD